MAGTPIGVFRVLQALLHKGLFSHVCSWRLIRVDILEQGSAAGAKKVAGQTSEVIMRSYGAAPKLKRMPQQSRYCSARIVNSVQ